MTALYLQFLEHSLFRVNAQVSLLKKTLRKKSSISLNEYISIMKAAEQLNESIKLVIDFCFTHFFESSLEFIVAIGSNVVRVVRSVLTLVHEILECHNSSFFDSKVVLRNLVQHFIHLKL